MKKAQQKNVWRRRARFAALAFPCLALFLASPPTAASAERQSRTVQAPLLSQFAIADFDGDSRPDLATVQTGQEDSRYTRYWIALELSSGARQIIGITAPAGGLHVASRDVNGDNFLDVVVTTSWANRPVAVLLNDGFGNFTSLDPADFPGAFSASEKSWTTTTDKIRNSCGILLSRYSSREGEEHRRIAPPEDETALLLSWASHPVTGSLFVFSSGRAPPSLLHCQ